MLSVVIPTFERPVILREALRSVALQTVLPDEVIVSDNHSRERSDSIAAEFPKLNLRYHWHEKPLAVDAHWLWALGQAGGEKIALLEDDNLWRSRHLEVLQAGLDEFPQAGLAGTAGIVFSELIAPLQRSVFAPAWRGDLLESRARLISRGLALATCLFGPPFAASAVMFRSAVFQHAAVRATGLTIVQDHLLWASLMAEGGAVYCPATTLLYREHEQQLVTSFPRRQFRDQALASMDLVLGLINREGVNLSAELERLRAEVSTDTARLLAYRILQLRNAEHARRIIPALLGKANFADCLPRMAIIALRQKLFGRVRR